MQSLRSCGRFELQNNVPCRRATFINVQRFVNSRVCTLQPLRASTLLDAPTTRNKPLSEASFPEAGQTCNSQLPPFGMKASKLKSWQDGVWSIEQDLGLPKLGLDIGLSCFVIRLNEDGDMLVNSPVSLTGEVKQMMQQVAGTVKHIVLPNVSPEHFIYAGQWAAAYPQATFWVAQEMLDGKGVAATAGLKVLDEIKASNKNIRILQDGAPPELEGKVEICIFRDPGGALSEATLYFPQYGAITMADLAFAGYNNKQMDSNAISALFGKIAGVYRRLGSPAAFMVMLKERETAVKWKNTVSSWKWDTILTSHLDPVVIDGRMEFNRCFKFLD